MPMSIREATLQDARGIAYLLAQLGYPATSQIVEKRLSYWTDNYSEILIAHSDERPVGCVSIHAIPYLERTGHWARITSLVVDQEARGSGIGRCLVERAETIATRWECLGVEVTSDRCRQAAHAFYKRLGYVDICDRTGRFHRQLCSPSLVEN